MERLPSKDGAMDSFQDATAADFCDRWPSVPADERSPSPAVIAARIAAALDPDGRTVLVRRELVCGGDVLTSAVCWSYSFPDEDGARASYDFLTEDADRLRFLANGALAFGAAWLLQTLEEVVATRREHEALKSELRLRQAETARLQAEESRRIEAFFLNHDGHKRLSLERGRTNVAVWTVDFDQAWERDRFWDWLKWQTHRFEGFAGMLESIDGHELEKLLLTEMLATETLVKKQGLGSGGRRPLRFWRG